MPRNPVSTQMAVTAFKNPLGSDNKMEGRTPCWRRVFVQTDTGCVLGMELDRSDNAHTVKKRLQLALNIPVEESSLTFGDIVLKNDLSAIQNDSPLLLTKNLMHRSSSTPCLSPTGRDTQKKDQSGPIEILGHSNRFPKIKQIVKEIVKGVKNGVYPIPVESGLGGAYYFRNVWGESVAIVKPTDEEPFAPNNPKGFIGKALGQPGLKRSVRVGETGFREVAAYLLDYDHFANVPPTALVKITHSIFNINGVNGNGGKSENKKLTSKIASFQQYMRHDFDAADHGTSSFPVTSVHRIGILDIRILNTDRHAGNLLVRKLDDVGRFGQVELIPIDHGLCLPESLEDPYFEWIHWPQSSIPFSDDELEYIRNLDPVRDSQMLRAELPMIRDACLRVLFLCTVFLKEAAAYGLCLAEIGEMMSREFRSGDEEPSELEAVCMEAKRLIAEEIISPKGGSDSFDEIQFDLDFEDGGGSGPDPMFYFGLGGVSVTGFNLLSKLDECAEEEEEGSGGDEMKKGLVKAVPNISKLTVASLKSSTSLGEKSRNFFKFAGVKQEAGSQDSSSSSGHRSANEQIPASASFVKVADMNDREWGVFLEKFQELLYPAIVKRKSVTLGQRQRLRLGTSCQF